MLKTALAIMGLLVSSAPQPSAHHYTPEIGVSLPVVQIIKQLDAPSVKNIAKLDYAPFQFAPMGTYANSFEPANCTWGAASMKHVPWSGNANTWDDNARAAGYTVSTVPVLGAIAQTDRGYYGHVAVVSGISAGVVMITEMNYDGNGGVRTRPALPGEFVYIYI
jgi:surface antigen